MAKLVFAVEYIIVDNITILFVLKAMMVMITVLLSLSSQEINSEYLALVLCYTISVIVISLSLEITTFCNYIIQSPRHSVFAPLI